MSYRIVLFVLLMTLSVSRPGLGQLDEAEEKRLANVDSSIAKLEGELGKLRRERQDLIAKSRAKESHNLDMLLQGLPHADAKSTKQRIENSQWVARKLVGKTVEFHSRIEVLEVESSDCEKTFSGIIKFDLPGRVFVEKTAWFVHLKGHWPKGYKNIWQLDPYKSREWYFEGWDIERVDRFEQLMNSKLPVKVSGKIVEAHIKEHTTIKMMAKDNTTINISTEKLQVGSEVLMAK